MRKFTPPRDVKSIESNWHFTQTEGAKCEKYTVGEGVSKIDYFHDKFGRHFCDVHFSGGEKKRVFVINSITFSQKKDRTPKVEYK